MTKTCPANARSNLYDDITNRIIAELEAGVLPWPRTSPGAYASDSDRLAGLI
jgi:antirestriction protein ArdC